MQKLKVKLFDTNFSHHAPGSSISSFPGQDVYPEWIEWVREPNVECDYAFFSDNCLNLIDVHPHKYNFAWIIEPRALVPNVYKQIENPELYNKFTKVLTHDSKLLELDENKFISCPLFGTWVSKKDARIYKKTKNICMILSYKRNLPGHKLRYEIIEKLSSKYAFDIYGNGTPNPFKNMVDVIKDYRYCIVIENVKDGHWITEKILGPISCGCWPIYYGSERLKDYHLKASMFNSIEELENIFSNFDEALYKKLSDYGGEIENNFHMVWNRHYNVLEDYILEFIIQPLVKNNESYL